MKYFILLIIILLSGCVHKEVAEAIDPSSKCDGHQFVSEDCECLRLGKIPCKMNGINYCVNGNETWIKCE